MISYPSSSNSAVWMTSTQCSDSLGLGASAPHRGPSLFPSDCGSLPMLLTKPHGLCNIHGPGEEGVSPARLHGGQRALGPSISAFKPFPLFSGDLGGPACCPPSVFSSPCCHVSLLPNWVSYPSSALGIGARFLRPHALDRPHPQSGNSGHQVPCIEPSLLVSFSQT